MASIPIILGIARKSGDRGKAPGAPGRPKILTPDLKKAVFDRDQHVCQCCGFKSEKYQEVHYLDHDRTNLAMDNLATLCVFCHQCFNLDQVSVMRSGVLVWLPEIDQATLHHVVRAIYVARISQGPMAEAARKVLDILMSRREEAKRRIHTDDPYVLASVMKDYLTGRNYGERGIKLEGVRLFPLDRRLIREGDLEFNQFPQILAYWRSKDGPFGNRAPGMWIELYRDALRSVGATPDAGPGKMRKTPPLASTA